MHAALAQQRYKQQGVLTANPVELIVMLYDGCIRQLKISVMAIHDHDIEKANTALQKAQLIVMELINSLNLSYSIAKDLLSLYDFVTNEIIQANAEKNAERIEPIIQILDDLRDAWKTLAKEGAGAVRADEE